MQETGASGAVRGSEDTFLRMNRFWEKCKLLEQYMGRTRIRKLAAVRSRDNVSMIWEG